MADTSKIETALKKWLAVEKAVTHRMERHFADMTAGDASDWPEPLYESDLAEISQLRQAEEAARQAYAEALADHGFSPPHGFIP